LDVVSARAGNVQAFARVIDLSRLHKRFGDLSDVVWVDSLARAYESVVAAFTVLREIGELIEPANLAPGRTCLFRGVKNRDVFPAGPMDGFTPARNKHVRPGVHFD
jgi:hypothetical protein